jgi:hypothetical protein
VAVTRKIGEINAAEKQQGKQAKGARGNPRGRGAKIVRVADKPTQSLADRGVDKNLAHRARALWAMPDGYASANMRRSIIPLRPSAGITELVRGERPHAEISNANISNANKSAVTELVTVRTIRP